MKGYITDLLAAVRHRFQSHSSEKSKYSALGRFGEAFAGACPAKSRRVAAYLVPKQHSSGGKPVLLGISKRGDGYLRSLLVHAARAVVRQSAHKTDRLNGWINRLKATRGVHKTIVALANKLARIGWAILRYETPYQPASA